jgi:hypothetical protein
MPSDSCRGSCGYHRCPLPHDARLTICGAGKTPNVDVIGSGNLTTASGGRPQSGQRRRFSLSVTTASDSSNALVFETRSGMLQGSLSAAVAWLFAFTLLPCERDAAGARHSLQSAHDQDQLVTEFQFRSLSPNVTRRPSLPPFVAPPSPASSSSAPTPLRALQQTLCACVFGNPCAIERSGGFFWKPFVGQTRLFQYD